MVTLTFYQKTPAEVQGLLGAYQAAMQQLVPGGWAAHGGGAAACTAVCPALAGMWSVAATTAAADVAGPCWLRPLLLQTAR